MNLLPKHHDEFQSKEYWDSFFAQRGDKAFEWYGSYADLRGHCLRHVDPQDKILMLGCGNSSFSADLYDNHCTSIVNVDFSETLIENMRAQNLAARPLMSWDVMDMTALTYSRETFDVVFDKGALDALLSMDDAGLLQKASDMFDHIDRVLVPGGKYLCVSLCEEYIAAHLTQSFLLSQTHTRAYSLSIEIITPATPSPFKPFFLTFTKPKTPLPSQSHSEAPRVQVHFDSFGSPRKSPISVPMTAAMALILQSHAFTQKRFQLSKVEVGRYEVFDVHAADMPEGEGGQIPRFSVIIFDHAARAARSCAVFFVPPGRETDYQFTSDSGLAALAAQAQCRRLLAVRCNRPHVFPAMADLQSELSPIAMYLAPADIGPPDEDPIPFLAVQQDSDWAAVDRGSLEVAGQFVVEEMAADEEENVDKYVWRRLLFLENQHFIQTEAKLLNPAGACTGKKAKGGAASKKKKGGKSKSKSKRSSGGGGGGDDDAGSDLFLFDHSYLDDHHKAMLVALLCDNTPLISAGSQSRTGSAASGDEAGVRVLLVGLGGGALAMALQRYLPALHLDVLDLVPGLDDLATKHFGFVAGPRCRTLVQDGVQYILQQQPRETTPDSEHVFHVAKEQAPGEQTNAQYHSVLLDVDSKDGSLGLSAPPAAFLTHAFLTHLHDHVLLPGGSLCVNVVARDKSKLADLVALLKKIFCVSSAPEIAAVGQAKVYCVKPSADTVNLTVHAVKRASTGDEQPMAGLAKQLQTMTISSKKSKQKKSGNSNKASSGSTQVAELKARERCLDEWLSAVNLSSDPLDLSAILDVVVEA